MNIFIYIPIGIQRNMHGLYQKSNNLEPNVVLQYHIYVISFNYICRTIRALHFQSFHSST